MSDQLTIGAETGTTPAEHPSYPKLTAEQKRSINEVWDDYCVPALEHVDRMKREVDQARIEAQDAREGMRAWRDRCERLLWATRSDG